MASVKKPSPLFLLLACAVMLAALASPLGAAECGSVVPGSGTCSGDTHQIGCNKLENQGCCGLFPKCEWSEDFVGDEYSCTSLGGFATVHCAEYNDNQIACSQMGCTFTFTGTGSCGTNNGAQGYGESCSSDAQCAKCLVCDTAAGKCTQRPGMCSTIPAEYVAPPPAVTEPGLPGSPQEAIGEQESGTGGAVVGSSSAFYKAGWFSDWKAMGLIGVAIVCSIIALAAMMGTAFNLPEIKAFANTEIRQAVISALLIVSLVALVTFFDEMARLSIEGADLPITCVSGEPCYVTSAKFYLSTLQDTGNEYARNELGESIKVAKRASLGYNLNLNKIYLLFAGISVRFNAGDSLVAERHGALFTQAGKMLSSLYAQKYFVDVVTFGIAPMLILLGVVLRTFFFTRKLGGLLLAIAISLFLIYPLTFAFAWYTLNVTVYGERTLGVADPLCPAECTGTYPVAFFTDPATGGLVQFSTTQSIMRAGITKNNWDSGGPGGAFPGLVACRDLSSINIPAANACPDCPDYCRDVPFPSGMPGCDIEKCSECNSGCKIVRQRLTCQTDPACAGKCPLSCRTQIPLENKCFSDEEGGVIEADLSISCEGCGKYPHWCRFLKKEADADGNDVYTPIYDDEACDGIEADLACPFQCSYITTIGTDDTCDSICSYKNPDTGSRTICPAQCRVLQLFDDEAYPGWVSTYDIDPPNFAEFCSSTPEIEAACGACSAHPECMVEAWDAAELPAECAAYPVNNEVPMLCLQCPDYCRRDDFTGVFATNGEGAGYSNVERDEDDVPAVCDPAQVEGMDCSTTGSPPACDASCRMDGTPLLCRTLDASDPDASLCRHCPEPARFSVRYLKIGPEGCLDCNPVCYNQFSPADGSAVFQSAKGKTMASGAGKYEGTIWLEEIPGPPEMALAYVSPIPAYPNADLMGNCMATDPNSGDYVTYEYQWRLNGELYGSAGTTALSLQGVELVVDTVPSAELEIGQSWTISCFATDEGGLGSFTLESASVSIEAPPGEPECTVTITRPQLQPQYNCEADVCGGDCAADDYVDLPNEEDDPACGDATVTGCPYGCRVNGLGSYRDPECVDLCADLPSQCFVSVPQTWPVCGEYVGNGGASCQGSTCSLFTSPSACNGADEAGCNWNSDKQYCEKIACTAISNPATCSGTSGCAWMRTESLIPIANREIPYDNPDSCLQCPEQCRLDGYTGSCGLGNNPGGDTYVDCSISSCPVDCRIEPRPLAPDNLLCLAYPETTGQSCKDCPALCRRQSDLFSSMEGCLEYPSCALASDPNAIGCIDQCRFDNPPDKACEGCFDCDYDCSFYPAIRTDCSDICSDEALAGPVNIAPDDFAKSLPGATTSEEGMGARNVGTLFIPAVVLPLFCIVIVVAFIRVLSPILGGDIEIPGLGRII
ncbi:MAG: hypothetical protein WC717_03680 [Candidatus Micrarchaeia archaeon]|jgi:hypothetical protein